LRISFSSWLKQPSSGVQSSKGPRLLALSRFSMSCSKLSKATSLSSTLSSGSLERTACMEEIIKSASLGPPISAAKAAGSRPRDEGGAASGSAADAAEFSTPHLRRLLSPGSIVLFGGCRFSESRGY